MKSIWKFKVPPVDVNVLEIPRAARLLTLQVQDGQPCMWLLVDPEMPKVSVEIHTYGTGHALPHDIETSFDHLGSYQLEDGRLVFHVFGKLPL